MRTADFDFNLPEERIALHPADPGDSARLLVVRPGDAVPLVDRVVGDLPELLRRGDVAGLQRYARHSGGAGRCAACAASSRRRSSFNLIKRARREPLARVRAAGQAAAGGRPHPLRRKPTAASACSARSTRRWSPGATTARSSWPSIVARRRSSTRRSRHVGRMPLPPYIAAARPPGPEDRDSYQTILPRTRAQWRRRPRGCISRRLWRALRRRAASRATS